MRVSALPDSTGCRPAAMAARATLSTRARLEAKQVTATLPLQPRTNTSRLARTLASEPSLARNEDIGAVAHHGKRAFVANALQRLLVGDVAQQRIGIDLPVAGVEHGAERRADGQCIGLEDRMGHGDHLELERRRCGTCRRAVSP